MGNLLADAELNVRDTVTAGLNQNGYGHAVNVVLGHILDHHSERFDGGHSEVVSHLIFLVCLDDLGHEALREPRASKRFSQEFSFLNSHFAHGGSCVGLVRAEQGLKVLHESVFSKFHSQITDSFEDCHPDTPMLVLGGVLE